MKMHLPLLGVLFFLAFHLCDAQTPKEPKALNGPWKFRVGDNTGWSSPDFNDASWENLDFTPKAGAHDGDVGLTGYVPGWTARGYAGHWGYGWYRLHLSLDSLSKGDTVLLAPTLVDDAYQLYINGKLVDGVGDFSVKPPSVFSTIPKRIFLPRKLLDSLNAKQLIIAFRVWASPRTISEADDAGGIHVAPMLGTDGATSMVYHRQWIQTYCGYVADAVEPLLFVLLAILVYRRKKRFHDDDLITCFIAALIVTALVRASQVFYYWGQWESLGMYYMSKEIILTPLSIGLWAMAWHRWFDLKYSRNISWAIASLAVLYILSQFFSFSWQYQTLHPHGTLFGSISAHLRQVFIVVMFLIIAAAITRHRRKAILPVIAMLLLCSGLFAGELSEIGIPGIWFPFGVGVSRTQYVYVVFDAMLLTLILFPKFDIVRYGY